MNSSCEMEVTIATLTYLLPHLSYPCIFSKSYWKQPQENPIQGVSHHTINPSKISPSACSHFKTSFTIKAPYLPYLLLIAFHTPIPYPSLTPLEHHSPSSYFIENTHFYRDSLSIVNFQHHLMRKALSTMDKLLIPKLLFLSSMQTI